MSSGTVLSDQIGMETQGREMESVRVWRIVVANHIRIYARARGWCEDGIWNCRDGM